MIIPQVKIPRNKGLIPQQVAELKVEEDPESKPFLISYQKYNDGICQIEYLVKNCPKRALQDLKKIGKDITAFKDFGKYGIDSKPIRNENNYKELFKGLHGDVELYEHKIQQTARIFYFLNEPEKIVYIVAITQNHFETEKNRR